MTPDTNPHARASTCDSALPLISVVILYYKRRETIAESIESVLHQTYSNLELILVDNHSEDGLKPWLGTLGYDVKLIELPQNLGTCGGRNAGIRAARGEIVVCLEDDISFLSRFELTNLLKVFELHPNIHVLALKICNPDTGKLSLREWCHARSWKESAEHEFETNWFGEGASAFRREVFDSCGLYYEPLFYGVESHELIIRLMNGGCRILYTPHVRVGHRAAKSGRTPERQFYYYTRNYFWLAYKNHHFANGVRFLLPKLLMMFYFALRTRNFRPFFRGIFHGITGLRRIRADRTRATKATERYFAEIEKYRPGLMVRFARHRQQPQI
jgi:GT2 family glycosyltransferase